MDFEAFFFQVKGLALTLSIKVIILLKTAMSTPLQRATLSPLPQAAPIQQLHHYAYRAKDAEETRHFYEDILGLPLYHIIQSDHVPSTGEYCPYTHFFFRLMDGSFIAFFDLGMMKPLFPPPTPRFGSTTSPFE